MTNKKTAVPASQKPCFGHACLAPMSFIGSLYFPFGSISDGSNIHFLLGSISDGSNISSDLLYCWKVGSIIMLRKSLIIDCMAVVV